MKNTFTLLLVLVTNFCFAQQRTTVNQIITSGDVGIACVGGFLDKDHISTPSSTDFARLAVVANVSCTQWLRGELNGPGSGGFYAGFHIRTTSLVNLLSTITVATYNGATRQEARSGGTLLQLVAGGEGYVYFQTTLPHTAVQLEIGGALTALFTTDVFLGFSQAADPIAVLPIKFNALQATRQSGVNSISWKLAGDENLQSMQVERSLDGRTFSTIAEVSVNPSGRYEHKDFEAKVQSYYRVKATTLSGTVYQSEVVSVKAVENTAIAIQNPVNGKVVLQTATTSPVTIRIHNTGGQLIAESVKRGGGSYTVPLASAKPGLYIVSIYDEQQLVQQARVINL